MPAQQYAQQQAPAQQKAAPEAASILDDSSQNVSLQRKADLINNTAQTKALTQLKPAEPVHTIKINFKEGSPQQTWGNQGNGPSNAGNSTEEYTFSGASAMGGASSASPSINAIVNAATLLLNRRIRALGKIHLTITGFSRGTVIAGLLYQRFTSNTNITRCDLIMQNPGPSPDEGQYQDQNDFLPSNNDVAFHSLGRARQERYYHPFFSPQRLFTARVNIILTRERHSSDIDSAIQRQGHRFRFHILNTPKKHWNTYSYEDLYNMPAGCYQVRRIHGRICELEAITKQQATSMMYPFRARSFY